VGVHEDLSLTPSCLAICCCDECVCGAASWLETLKVRNTKQRERKQRHQNSGIETTRNGNNGTVLQGVKNARHIHSGTAEY